MSNVADYNKSTRIRGINSTMKDTGCILSINTPSNFNVFDRKQDSKNMLRKTTTACPTTKFGVEDCDQDISPKINTNNDSLMASFHDSMQQIPNGSYGRNCSTTIHNEYRNNPLRDQIKNLSMENYKIYKENLHLKNQVKGLTSKCSKSEKQV